MKIGNKARKNVVGILTMIIVYYLLFYYVSEKEIISAMLTSGSGSSRFDVILSLLFIFLRLFIIVLLPGTIISMLASSIYSRIVARKTETQARY